jgi:hypothetical protein
VRHRKLLLCSTAHRAQEIVNYLQNCGYQAWWRREGWVGSEAKAYVVYYRARSDV